MDSDRWKQVDSLLHAVLEHPCDKRAEFLRGACKGDEYLELEVRSLLAAHEEAGSFLEIPAIQLAARAFARTQEPETAEDGYSLAGQLISHYRIIEKLGSGGMGVVYKAEDTRLDRLVAIKLLTDDISRDPHALTRFRREARAISSLNHLHICTLYDVGPNFLVMELIEGETIAGRLKSGPLPVKTALLYASQIVAALAAKLIWPRIRAAKPQPSSRKS